MMRETMTALLVAALLVGCAPQEQGPILIGWIGPQTGQSAVLGMDSALAAQIAVDEINAAGGIGGRQVRLIVEDDQYDIAKAVSAYQKLVQVDGARIIVASTYGSVFALAPRAEQDGVLLIDPLDCNSELAALGDHVFCLATDSESIGQVLAARAQEDGAERLGILYWNSDTFMPLVKDVVVEEFEGEEFLEAYGAGTNDFRTQLLKMQDADVDALVLLGYDETGNAMRQARELGFTGTFYTTGTVTSPGLQDAARGHAEGAVLAFWDAPEEREAAQRFAEAFIARQGRPPILDLASYPTYDAIKVLALAIERAGSEDPQTVGRELLGVQGFEGATGMVSFAVDGSVRIPERAYVLRDGKATG